MVLKVLSPKELQLQKLIEIYRKAEAQIKKELTRKRALDLVDYADAAALKRVQQTLLEMTQAAEEQAPIAIESFFDNTADAMITTKTNIVIILVNNYMGRVEEAAEVAYQSAFKFLAVGRLAADEIRQASLELVAQKEAVGKGWHDIQRKLAIDLNNKGITSFVDKAGREWDMTSYCSMLTRTTGRQAQVAAALTENDWDLWQISKHGTTCALCSAYEGRVYSKSGTDPDYPPLYMAFGKIDAAGSNDLSNTYLNIHPNCLHQLIPYTTAGKTDEEIQEDKDFSSFEKRPADVDYRTELERDQYRAKEKARAEYRNDRKQFEKYKAAGVDDMPVRFQTFEKNKRANTQKYQEWEKKYRNINKEITKVDKEVESAIEKQTGLFTKYGNLNNMYLTGTPEDLQKWSDLSKVTNLSENDLITRLTENSKTWENVLNSQNEAVLKPFTDQLQSVATQEELSALRIWSGESYADINRYMRGGENVGRSLKNTAENIENVLNKTSTPRDLIVRRGTGTREIFADMPDGWKQDPTKLIGKSFRDKGFVATSPVKSGGFSGAGQTQAEMFIKVPKGTKGAYIVSAAKNSDEAEFLLQRGYSYRIVNAEYRSNPIFPDENDLKVWVEVIK